MFNIILSTFSAFAAIAANFYGAYTVHNNLSQYAAMAKGNSPNPNARLGHLLAAFIACKIALGGSITIWTLAALPFVALIVLQSYLDYGKPPQIWITLSQIISSLKIPLIGGVLQVGIGVLAYYKEDSQLSWRIAKTPYPKLRSLLGKICKKMHILLGLALFTYPCALFYSQPVLATLIPVATFYIALVLLEMAVHSGWLSQISKNGLHTAGAYALVLIKPAVLLFNILTSQDFPNTRKFLYHIYRLLVSPITPLLSSVEYAQSLRLKSQNRDHRQSSKNALQDLYDIHTKLNQNFTQEEIARATKANQATFAQTAMQLMRKLLEKYSLDMISSFIEAQSNLIVLFCVISSPLISISVLAAYFLAKPVLDKVARHYYPTTFEFSTASDSPAHFKHPGDNELKDESLILKGHSEHLYTFHKMPHINDSRYNCTVKAKLRYQFNPEKLKQVPAHTLGDSSINQSRSDADLDAIIKDDIIPKVEKLAAQIETQQEPATEVEKLKQNLPKLIEYLKQDGLKSSRGISSRAPAVRYLKFIIDKCANENSTSVCSRYLTVLDEVYESTTVCPVGIDSNFLRIANDLSEATTLDAQMDAASATYRSSFWRIISNKDAFQLSRTEDSSLKSYPIDTWVLYKKILMVGQDQADTHTWNQLIASSGKNLPTVDYLTIQNDLFASGVLSNLTNAFSIPVIHHLAQNEWMTFFEVIEPHIDDYLKTLKTSQYQLSDLDVFCKLPTPRDTMTNEFMVEIIAQQAHDEMRRNGIREINPTSVADYISKQLPSFPLNKESKKAIQNGLEALAENSITPTDIQEYFTGLTNSLISQLTSDYEGKQLIMTQMMLKSDILVESDEVCTPTKSEIFWDILKSLPRCLLDLPGIIKHTVIFLFRMSIDIICLPISAAKLSYASLPAIRSSNSPKSEPVNKAFAAPAA